MPPHRQMQRLVARLIFLVVSERSATSRRPSVGPSVPSRVASRIFGCHVSSRPLPYQRIWSVGLEEDVRVNGNLPGIRKNIESFISKSET